MRNVLQAIGFVLIASVGACDACNAGCGQGCGQGAPAEDPSARSKAGDDQAPQDAHVAARDAGGPEHDPDEEACARAIRIPWKGAQGAAKDIERTKPEAKKQANEMHRRVTSGGESFADVASEDTNEFSGLRAGRIPCRTYGRWPDDQPEIKKQLFDLDEGEVSEVFETPRGWTFVKRYATGKIHLRHILVRHKDAKFAEQQGVERSHEEARMLAEKLRQRIVEGEELPALAREYSDHEESAANGGYVELESVTIAPKFEKAARSLEPNELSDVIESRFGFHLIKRLEGAPE